MKPKYWTKANGTRVKIIAMKNLNLVHALRMLIRFAYLEGENVEDQLLYQALKTEYDLRHPEDNYGITERKEQIDKNGILFTAHTRDSLAFLLQQKLVKSLERQLRIERKKLKELRKKR